MPSVRDIYHFDQLTWPEVNVYVGRSLCQRADGDGRLDKPIYRQRRHRRI